MMLQVSTSFGSVSNILQQKCFKIAFKFIVRDTHHQCKHFWQFLANYVPISKFKSGLLCRKTRFFFSSFFTQFFFKWMKSPNLILLMHFQDESHTTAKYILYMLIIFITVIATRAPTTK